MMWRVRVEQRGKARPYLVQATSPSAAAGKALRAYGGVGCNPDDGIIVVTIEQAQEGLLSDPVMVPEIAEAADPEDAGDNGNTKPADK